MFVMRFRLLIATLWVGSLWTIGYVVAPTLFATLYDKVLAGTIAGRLFHTEAWLSVGCAIALAVTWWPVSCDDHRKMRLLYLIAAMLVCAVMSYFVPHPFMADLRASAGPAGIMASSAKRQFAVLHGISSVFYLIESLLGAGLIFKLRG